MVPVVRVDDEEKFNHHLYSASFRNGEESENSNGGYNTFTSHNVDGFTLEPLYGGEPLDIPFSIDPDKEYYLLYAVYSTGDSCNRDENSVIHFIGLYENRNIAETNLNRISERTAFIKENRYRFDGLGQQPPHDTLLNMTGESEYKFDYGWEGYFERLSYVEILPCGINVGKKRVSFI